MSHSLLCYSYHFEVDFYATKLTLNQHLHYDTIRKESLTWGEKLSVISLF